MKLDTQTFDEIVGTLRKFCEKYLSKQHRLELDKNETFPEDLVRRMISSEVGLHLIFLPEEYGGFGAGAYEIYRISEEMAKIDLGLATAFLAISLGTDPLRVGGTEEQKKRWMTQIAERGLIVAYGATEPCAGSDLTAIRTKAEPVQNSDGKVIAYRLNGVKQFITNGGVADLYSILAMTPGGPSFFVIERGTKGLSYGKPEEKHGVRLSNTSQVILDNVEIPADQLIGLQEGQGLAQAIAVFGYTRLMVAAFGLGGGEAALELTIAYSKERSQFGKKLVEMEGYSHKLLIPYLVRLEAARAYIEYVANRLDSGETGLETEGAIAKLFASETGNQTAEAAIQGHGGYGYVHEYEVEKIKRDVRITMIYEGTSEILQQTIAKDRWRRFLQTRGGFYLQLAGEMENLAKENAQCGATAVSAACKSLVTAMETIRTMRLTRNQYVLFRMADMATAVETAASLCRKACTYQKENHKKAEFLCTAARIYASEAVSSIFHNSMLCVAGFGSQNAGEMANYYRSLNPETLSAQYVGFGQDMEKMVKFLE